MDFHHNRSLDENWWALREDWRLEANPAEAFACMPHTTPREFVSLSAIQKCFRFFRKQ